MRRWWAITAIVALVAGYTFMSPAGATTKVKHSSKLKRSPIQAIAGDQHFCNTNGIECTEPYQNWADFTWYNSVSKRVEIYPYIGHDEPSNLFYSNTPGSGNNNTYLLKLPKDAPIQPRQDGSGGTWNFQLRPTFWFGMAMCDDQSAPNPGVSSGPDATIPCTKDSDSNIFDNPTPGTSDFMGLHPGSAFMEFQFYPPGWVNWPAGNGCSAHQWCAALNIDSFSENMDTGTVNNDDCLSKAGIEPVNFAFATKNGVSTAPANPLEPGDQFIPDPKKDFLMNPGDTLKVQLFDRVTGFRVVIHDLTTGTTGSMNASASNGFGAVNFDPNASACSVTIQAFHPMYSTSSEHTRVVWAAHSYNVAFSDEIGHFEACNAVNPSDASCAEPAGFDTNVGDPDDVYCLPIPGDPGSQSTLIKINGCLGIPTSDTDFDGVMYGLNWPGTFQNAVSDALLHSQPVRFRSPTFNKGANFDRTAFEVNLSRIEDFRPGDPFGGVMQNCQRFVQNPSDPSPGTGCFDPPPQSLFYPFYTTTRINHQCWWQEGGNYIPHTVRHFGGSSHTEFGPLTQFVYPSNFAGDYTTTTRDNDFHQTISFNPCAA